MHKSLSEQLEPLAWRTTQREAQRGYEHEATIDKWADIIAVIMNFQNTMNGSSPANLYIAKQLGISAGQVAYHLKRMQERGLIEDDMKWPRHITIFAAKVQKQETLALDAPKVEEAVTMDSSEIGGKTRRERKAFLDTAKEFAQHLQDHYDRHGEAPLMKDIAKAMGYSQGGLTTTGRRKSTTGGLSHVVRDMVAEGWLYHTPKCQRDMVLTGLGRAVLFGEPLRETIHTDIPVRPQPSPIPMANAFPAKVEVRRASEPTPMYIPQPQAPTAVPVATTGNFTGTLDLSNVDTVDLLLELQSRGLKVSR